MQHETGRLPALQGPRGQQIQQLILQQLQGGKPGTVGRRGRRDMGHFMGDFMGCHGVARGLNGQWMSLGKVDC